MSGRAGLSRARDEAFMRRALELAARGLGETNPNPVVGCLVVRDGRPVGEGWHARAGGPHAEVMALRQAGARARGATLYVSLEPCAHFGRTPPCAPLVRDSGVARVVVAIRDPNPAVSGAGLALLRRAGIEVDCGVLPEAAARLNVPFLHAARRPRPFVLLKAAITLDGRIATARGSSKWITSPEQRRQARWLRRLHDAVLVGIGTVLADDPLLLPQPRTRRPSLRVVLDSRLRLPLSSRLVVSVSPRSPVLVLGSADHPARRRALEAAGVEVVLIPAAAGRVDLKAALAELRRRAIGGVMVEGGSETLGAFLRARLFDELALFRAPLLLGGRGSLSAFGGEDPQAIGEALRMELRPLDDGFPWPFVPQLELWRRRTRGSLPGSSS